MNLRLLLFASLGWCHACNYERDQVIQCLASHSSTYDTDGDNRISKHELDRMMQQSLGYFERALARSMGGVDKTMDVCDTNHDGFIEMDELIRANRCLNSCFLLEKLGDHFCNN